VERDRGEAVKVFDFVVSQPRDRADRARPKTVNFSDQFHDDEDDEEEGDDVGQYKLNPVYP
jgi:hypothetical protein